MTDLWGRPSRRDKQLTLFSIGISQCKTSTHMYTHQSVANVGNDAQASSVLL